MDGPLRIESLRGPGIATQLEALAALRIAVFREWPYLYAGSADYERRYLDVYLKSPRSLAVLAWDGTQCVGASTALPLADAGEDAQRPFREAGHDLDAIDYFGESVVLEPWRGRGLGGRFFEEREAHARQLGLPLCAFCAVVRPDDHPAKPPGHQGNAAFWRRRGYRPETGLTTSFAWPDLGETESSAKPMAFWLRDLRAAP